VRFRSGKGGLTPQDDPREHPGHDRKAPKDSVILAILPDTGERYFTTILFEGIAEGSNEEPAA